MPGPLLSSRCPLATSSSGLSRVKFPRYLVFIFSFVCLFLIEVFIYNVVLVSGVQQSDSVLHTHISIFFSDSFPIGYYKILSVVPCAIQ